MNDEGAIRQDAPCVGRVPGRLRRPLRSCNPFSDNPYDYDASDIGYSLIIREGPGKFVIICHMLHVIWVKTGIAMFLMTLGDM